MVIMVVMLVVVDSTCSYSVDGESSCSSGGCCGVCSSRGSNGYKGW